MSSPTRIAVFILVSLILIAAVLISVHGVTALHAGKVYERLDLTVGLTSDQSHVRTHWPSIITPHPKSRSNIMIVILMQATIRTISFHLTKFINHK